jgi:U3 small nucleolar RNA-associated protein 3
LCKQISSIDDKLSREIKFIKETLKAGRQLFFKKTSESYVKKIKKSVKFRDSISRSKRDSMLFEGEEDESENELTARSEKLVDALDEKPGSTKRGINYQIEKNKGLTPKRDKTYRNPRVRNRMKARKATIKRKSIVPKVREQDKRYSGEATGIRTGIVRAVKIK